MKPTVVSLALAVRMGSVPASVRAAVPCRRCRRETLSRFILSRFMNVLLLAGERLRRPPPSRGMVGWAVFRGRCGDFARVVPAAGGRPLSANHPEVTGFYEGWGFHAKVRSNDGAQKISRTS